jgi:serine/threonine protein kinase
VLSGVQRQEPDAIISPVPIATGTKLGSYEVQEFIGQGAMGLVYRVYHAQLERFGAVKVLQGIASGPDAAARFRHEAQAIAQMRHPNIVNVYDFGEFEGTPYMIVEYVPGGSLAGKMLQEPLDADTALGYLRGIAEGLDYAHSLGIVHRDVKPANVLLETNGAPVIADFGLVKLMQGSSIQSMTGVTTGTPAYMAPEQVMGHQVSAAADRYSLATIAYEMLTGSIPFAGEGVLELLYAHVHREPPAPSSRNAALSPAVDAVILRGLAKDPDARWQSCSAFVHALEGALVGVPVPGTERTVALPPPQNATKPLKPAPRAPKPSPEATIAMPMLEPVDGPPKPARSRRRLFEIVTGAVILLLLLLSAGICAAMSQTAKPTLAVDPRIAVPLETVTVTATHLPPNQAGEIQLLSQLYQYAFKADGQGNVSQPIGVPIDIGFGDHHIRLCWNDACPLQVPFKVVAPGTIPSPTPSASPSASPSPSGTPTGKPTPGKSPSPRSSAPATPTTGGSTPKASPRPSPRPSPSPSPSPAPSPVPSPSANPCPTPTAQATLTANPSTAVGGATVTLTGSNFTPKTQVTLKYYKGNATNPSLTWTVTAACNGSFTTSVKTLAGLVRTDHVKALDTAGRPASVNIGIIL